MKKNLLFACLVLTTSSFAQFTNTNAPADGDGVFMYVMDTNATNMAATTGTGVTWDYSTTQGVQGQNKSITVTTASVNTNGSSYPSAGIAIDIPGFITAFNTSSASAYSSQGFVFIEPTFGTVKVRFNTNDEALMSYPANVNDSWTDVIAGDVITGLGTFVCSGTAKTKVDGSGTLKLNAATTLSNVLRFRIEDSLFVDAGGFIGDVFMKRVQYEYYDLANNSLPVFIHTTLDLSVGGAPQSTGLVLSSVLPDTFLGVSSEELVNVTVYPNPAKETLNIGGLTENATVQIFSLNGQLVKTVELTTGTSSIAIQDLNAGTYLVKATTAKGTLTTKISVQ